MAENPKDNPPDLLDEVDSHLEEIEETTKAFTPQGEEAIDPNALISDDGSAVEAEVDAETSPEVPEAASDEETVIDSVESALQAVEALDEVEAQAAELTAQSVDALLSAETQDAEEPDQISEAATGSDTDSGTEETNDDLLESIDSLLDSPQDEIETIESLEDAVEELLDESESEEKVDAATEDNPDADPEGHVDTNSDSELSAAIEDLIDTLDPVDEAVEAIEPEAIEDPQYVEPAEAVETPAEPEAESAEIDELDDILDESSLIIENHETSAESAEDSIDLLDSALAEAADDMLDGDFEDEEGELVSGEATTTPIEQALEDTLSEDETPESAAEEVPAEQATSENDDSMEIDLDDALSALADTDSDQEPAELETTPAAESTTPAVSEEPIDSEIDDLLKDVADDLDDSQSPDQQAPAASTPAPTAPTGSESSPTQQADQPADQPADQEVLDEINSLEPAQAVEAESTPAPAWFVKAVEISRPKIDKIDPFKGKSMDVFASIVGSILVLAMIHAGPLGARVMIVVSKPLSNKSPEIRNAVGFIALWTAFLGVVLWLYLLMFRMPNIPQPDSAPTRVISVDESAIIQPVIQQLP